MVTVTLTSNFYRRAGDANFTPPGIEWADVSSDEDDEAEAVLPQIQ